ncbi:hypothetical protein K466DRAFT_249853 [Polyporus arcularius HHB13444]|uniref:Uncharacterized protein n=1 Tax=Polyporus arcularius HHB13444 TaxID=1314778 RepID=A0A5C3P6B6_9APHY|nr:hypothetical protein K466DRAFT_249853 [Polyporus arcularius HHB13444]
MAAYGSPHDRCLGRFAHRGPRPAPGPLRGRLPPSVARRACSPPCMGICRPCSWRARRPRWGRLLDALLGLHARMKTQLGPPRRLPLALLPCRPSWQSLPSQSSRRIPRPRSRNRAQTSNPDTRVHSVGRSGDEPARRAYVTTRHRTSTWPAHKRARCCTGSRRNTARHSARPLRRQPRSPSDPLDHTRPCPNSRGAPVRPSSRPPIGCKSTRSLNAGKQTLLRISQVPEPSLFPLVTPVVFDRKLHRVSTPSRKRKQLTVSVRWAK